MKSSSPVAVALVLFIVFPFTALSQLTGGTSYPINGIDNPPTSFATVKSAAAYLNASGVTGTGNITLELVTGYTGETDTVGIRAIPGADSTRRVIFRPGLGFTAVSSIAGLASPNQHTIRLAGASYVTLDGRAGGTGNGRDWTVRCTGTNGQMAVRLDNASGSMRGIVIRNLIMEAEAASTTGAVFQITGNSTNTITDIVVENNLIRSNPGAATFRGYCITIATASNAGNTGIVIRNNVLNQFYARGINFTGGFPGAKIYGNDIFHTAAATQPTTTEFAGIYMSTSSSAGSEIYNNFIHDIQLTNGTTGANGIQTLTLHTSGDPLKVYNNRIQIGPGVQGTTFPIQGIYQGGTVTGYLCDVFYNSVYIGGTATTGSANSAAFRKASSDFMNIRNNIFFNARSNSGGTGTHWGIMLNNTSVSSISNNDYFANGTGGVLGTHTGTTAGNDTALAQWRAAVTADVSSVTQNPNYIDPTATPPNMHLNATIPTQLESGAIPIAGISSDFEGDTRNATTPDIGADEGAFTPLDLTPPAIVYIPVGHSLPGAAQTLIATITDPSGVPATGIGRPVTYWKRNSGGAYSGATGTYTSNNRFSFSFGAGTVVGDTVYYFVAAQDSNNNVGVSPSAGAGGLTANPPAAATPPTNPNWYAVRPAFAGGTYTVGTTSGTYQTLKAAFDAINSSILTGNVTFSVLSQGTTETATANLGEVNYGPGGPFTITVKPAASTSPMITGSIPGFLVKFSGADNVVIDGSNTVGGVTRNLTLANTATTTNTGVIWVGSLGVGAGATNITVKNSNLIAARNDTTNTMGIYAATADTVTSSGTGADNNNLLIENNAFQRARYAVYSRGATPNGIQTGLVIRNNLMGSDSSGYELSYRAVDLGNTSGAAVSGNRIFNMLQSLGFTMEAIHLDINVSDAVISGNSIYKLRQTNTGSFGALGININTGTGSSNVTIANNMIAHLTNDGGGTSTLSNPYGIRIAGGTDHKVYYNSVSLAGQFQNLTTSDISAGFIATVSSATGLDLRNNIFSNTMTGGSGTKCYAIYAVSSSTVFGTINRNDYYAAGTNGVLGRQGTTDVPDLAGWRTFTGQDVNSVSGIPMFRDTLSNLHIDSTQTGLVVANAGAPIPGITTDIDGQTRHVSTPDIGADEFSPAAVPPPAEAWADHNTTAMRASVTNEGNIGSLNAFVGTGPGNGFMFNPVSSAGQRLFEGAIMLALDTLRVSDAARNSSSPEVFDADFKFLTNLDSSASAGNRKVITTSYTDSLAETPFGARVNQRTISFDTAGLNSILFVELDITNTSATPWTSLLVGGFFDWDVNPNAQDRGSVIVDSTNTIPGHGGTFRFDLMELHQSAIPNTWVGIVPLHQTRFKGRRIAISSAEIYPPHMTNTDKYLYMNANRATNPNGDAGAGVDHAQVFGLGPYTVAASWTKRVGFALVAGTSLQDFINNAREAQRAWVLRLGNAPPTIIEAVNDPMTGIPETFVLEQNYPNPFNPTTTLRYGLPEAAQVHLSIFNVLGQRVATVANEVQAAGYYNATWSGKNDAGAQVASGVYFYRIEATPTSGNAPFISLKKMMLVK